MRLNRRRVNDTIQYLTEGGSVIADLNGHTAHAIFALGIVGRKDLTIYDMDLKQVVYGNLEQLLKEE
jgi:hypothetical protein